MAGEELVRSQDENEQTRCTHFLEMSEGRTGQDKERKRSFEGHSLPKDDRGRDLSGHGTSKKTTKHKALTSYTRTAKGGTCQD